jgi:hypothetical protein
MHIRSVTMRNRVDQHVPPRISATPSTFNSPAQHRSSKPPPQHRNHVTRRNHRAAQIRVPMSRPANPASRSPLQRAYASVVQTSTRLTNTGASSLSTLPQHPRLDCDWQIFDTSLLLPSVSNTAHDHQCARMHHHATPPRAHPRG